MKIEKTINKITKEISSLKKEINHLILNLPDNPDITKLGNNCFTVNFKSLSKDMCLSPFYYDFKEQYKLIIKIIKDCDIKNIVKKIKEITTPKSKETYSTYYKSCYYRFNPEVIKNIKEILE